jgi:hypothetical protein
MNCEAAAAFCESELMLPAIAFGVNPYDISLKCDGELTDTLCYPESK